MKNVRQTKTQTTRKGISSCGIIPKIILEAQSKSKVAILTVFIEKWGFHRGNAQVRLYVR
jgi:hypothetical protein